jgi:quinol monooxygenase YgiN
MGRWRELAVWVVWETRLRAGTEAEGLALTQRIWSDMVGFPGYLAHEVLQDDDQNGHLLVVSRWESRQAADATKELYAGSPMVLRLAPLLAEERSRWVMALRDAYFK